MTMLPFGQVAPVSRRAVAYLIDALISGGLGVVLGGALFAVAMFSGGAQGMLTTLLIGGPVVSLVLVGWFVVYTAMQSGKGSIGMRAQGLRLVRDPEGTPLGFGRTLLRNVIFGLTASIVVGYFTPLFDGSGRFQGWHDKVAKSLMMDARVAPPVVAPPVVPEAPAPPLLPAPSFERLPPAPMPGFAPAAAPGTPQSASAAPVASPEPAAPPRPVVPAAPVAESGSLIAYVPGVTQDGPPPRVAPPAPAAPAAPPVPPLPVAAPAAPVPPQTPAAPVHAPQPPAPVTAPVQAADVADHEDDLEETRISIPGHRLVFTWDDGTRVSVSRRTVFGRNPAPEDGAVMVPVRDETLSLSKTHFEAAAETSGGWVLDRHSTNGMTIVRDGQRIACPAGQRVPIRLGDVIEIGDRVVMVGGYA